MAKSKIIKGSFPAPWEQELWDEISSPYETSEVKRLEADIIINQLNMILGRDPEIEDYKKVTLIHDEGIEDRYEVHFDNKHYGDVNIIVSGNKPKVTYKPKKLQ